METRFDVNRYLGLWYQIFSIRSDFNQDCDRSSAYYSLLRDGTIHIENTCYDCYWNEISKIAGTGNMVENGKLVVSFPYHESTEINYVVHQTDYESYAIVGNPQRSHVYLLSRREYMPEDQVASHLATVARKGYDLSKVTIDI